MDRAGGCRGGGGKEGDGRGGGEEAGGVGEWRGGGGMVGGKGGGSEFGERRESVWVVGCEVEGIIKKCGSERNRVL